MKFIFNQLRDAEEYLETFEISEERKAALKGLKSFIEGGSYTNYRKFSVLYSVRFASTEVQAKKLGVEITNLRRIKSLITQDALSVVGETAFETLMYGSEKDIKKLLKDLPLLTDDSISETMYSTDLIDLVNRSVTDTKAAYSISDCKPELALLYWLSDKRLPELISNVDADRLAFLLRCINRETGTKEDRAEILRVLLADDLFRHLKAEDKKIFSFPPVRNEEDF